MKENEYMDIAEFSKIVGVTKQAVYTSKRLKPYLKKIQGRYKVDRIAIKEVYGIEIEEPTKINETVLNGKIKALQREYNKLYRELEELRKYKSEHDKLDRKVIVALERAKQERIHNKELVAVYKERSKKDSNIIESLMEQNRKQTEMILEQNRKQAELIEQANVLKALELKKMLNNGVL